jgi:trypsin
MSRRGGYRAIAAVLGVLGVLAAIGVAVAAVTIGVAEAQGADQTSGTARLAGASVVDARVVDPSTPDASVAGPAAAVTYQVSEAAQHRALTHWTRLRMQGATAAELPRSLIRTAYPAVTRTPEQPEQPERPQRSERPEQPQLPEQPAHGKASSAITAPKGTPRAVPFSGSPTTGVLFYTAGGKGHFCTASVVESTADDLALTAAHCVYSEGFAANIEYVPGYHDGKRPYGVWPVRAITVTSGWKLTHDPDLDFAFLTLASAGGRPIQARTGGLTIGFTRWYSEKIEVIGHNDSGAEPVRCATKGFRFAAGQMEFYCHGFWTGTSGGPWIIGYNAKNGTGTVFGVIGGYELGGDYEWASYSAYFGSATRALYQQAERQATPHLTPTPTPSKSPTASPTPSKTPTASPTPSRTPTTPPTTASPTPAATAPDTAYPTTTPATPDTTASVAASPSPTGPVSRAYRPPVVAR